MALQPMKPECRQTIGKILGREFTEKESARWLADFRKEFRYVAGTDAAKGLTKDQIAELAAQRLAEGMKASAQRKRYLAQLTAVKLQEVNKFRDRLKTGGVEGHELTARVLLDTDRHITGLKQQFMSELVDTINAVDSSLLGMIEDAKTAGDLVRELWGVNTGNPRAAKGAKAWREVSEKIRERYNNAGGNIGDLGDEWRMPQSHDAYKVLEADKRIAKAGRKKNGAYDKYLSEAQPKTALEKRDAAKNAWVDFMFDRIDRSRYVDDNGKPLGDNDLKDVLSEVFRTITEGSNKNFDVSRVAKKRFSSFANKHSQHRQIFFKDAESFLEYHELFARNTSVLGTMMGHVNNMARDIGMLEKLGPAPQTMFDTLEARAVHEASAEGASKAEHFGAAGTTTDEMWSTLNGEAFVPKSVSVARGFQIAKDAQVWGKLGQAFISSVTDIGTYFVNTGYCKLPFFHAFENLLSTWSKADKEFAARAGLIADSVAGDVNRWTADNIGFGWSGKIANATMKMSLLEAWTNGLRRAFGLNMMAALGKMSRKAEWKDLDPWDRFQLEDTGITEKDWLIYRKAQTESHRGCDMLTAASIEKISDADLHAIRATRSDAQQAATKLLSYIMREEYMASLQPDLYTRAKAATLGKRGVVSGELVKSIAMFKQYPFGFLTAHIMRMKDKARFMRQEGSSGFGIYASNTWYAAKLIIISTCLGYLGNQAKTLIAGKDLEDPTSGETWLKAFTAGGGAGILGDILVNALDDTKYGHQNVLNALGPLFGSLLAGTDIYYALKDGKDAGAKTARFIRSNLPFINLWYVKMGMDHLILNELNEALSPGYTARMERRLRKNTGQGFWIKPGQGIIRSPRVADAP